jgi:hypothetical protein
MSRGLFESSLPFRPSLFKFDHGFLSWQLAPVRFRGAHVPGSTTKPPQLIVSHFLQSGSQLFAANRGVPR